VIVSLGDTPNGTDVGADKVELCTLRRQSIENKIQVNGSLWVFVIDLKFIKLIYNEEFYRCEIGSGERPLLCKNKYDWSREARFLCRMSNYIMRFGKSTTKAAARFINQCNCRYDNCYRSMPLRRDNSIHDEALPHTCCSAENHVAARHQVAEYL